MGDVFSDPCKPGALFEPVGFRGELRALLTFFRFQKGRQRT